MSLSPSGSRGGLLRSRPGRRGRHPTTVACSCRIAAQQQRAFAVLVEPIEQRAVPRGRRRRRRSSTNPRQITSSPTSASCTIRPSSQRAGSSSSNASTSPRTCSHRRDDQHRAAHVERRSVGRDIIGIIDEDEICGRIDESADQPRARATIDVTPRPCRPLHSPTPTSVAARASTATRARSRSGGGKKSRWTIRQ